MLRVPDLAKHIDWGYFESNQQPKAAKQPQDQPDEDELVIYRGQHICSAPFVQAFRSGFCREFKEGEMREGNLGPLFENDVFPNCNLISLSVSPLRLYQFHQTLVNREQARHLTFLSNQKQFLRQ